MSRRYFARPPPPLPPPWTFSLDSLGFPTNTVFFPFNTSLDFIHGVLGHFEGLGAVNVHGPASKKTGQCAWTKAKKLQECFITVTDSLRVQ